MSRREPLDLSDDRPRRRPAGNTGPQLGLWLVVTGAVAGGALAVVLGVMYLVPAKKPAAGVVSVDAADLYADYKADGATAAAKWGTQVARVKLRVDESKQIGSVLMLTQKGPGDVRVSATIPVGEAAGVKTGETVYVRGTCRGVFINVVDMGACFLDRSD